MKTTDRDRAIRFGKAPTHQITHCAAQFTANDQDRMLVVRGIRRGALQSDSVSGHLLLVPRPSLEKIQTIPFNEVHPPIPFVLREVGGKDRVFQIF